MTQGIFKASLCAAGTLAVLAMLDAPAVAQAPAAPQAAPAAAGACPGLKRLVQVKMVRSATGQEWVPVQLNGHDANLRLETVALHTTIDKPAAVDMQIATRTAPGAVGGNPQIAPLTSFKIANIEFGAVSMNVNPRPGPDYTKDKSFAGMLAADVLGHFDVDMDFGADTLSLFSPDHCAGKVVYWNPAAAVTIDLTFDKKGAAHFPVAVDGVVLDAVLDTSSAETVINLPSTATDALKLDVTAPDVTTVKDGANPVYQKTFKSLDLGGIAFNNVVLQAAVSPVLKQLKTSEPGWGPAALEAVRPANVIIGMSVLRKLHVYLATKENKLYVSPAGP